MRGEVLACLVVMAVAANARAADGPSGPELAARTGLGLPLGRVQGTTDSLSDTASILVPLWVDAGYCFAPRWYAGIYLMYGWGEPGGALHAGCDLCSVYDFRVGVNLQYHLFPGNTWDPWFGGGLGFEALSVHGPPGGNGPDALGWELANVQAGLDGRVSTRGRVGPFVALTLGQYEEGTTTTPFANKAFHGWFVVGVKGTYGFFR